MIRRTMSDIVDARVKSLPRRSNPLLGLSGTCMVLHAALPAVIIGDWSALPAQARAIGR